MFLVSVPGIFKITMGVPCAETTSKVTCKIYLFCNFAENSITLTLVCFKKLFQKIPF